MTKRSAIGAFARAAAPAAILMLATPAIAQTQDHAPVGLPDAQLMTQDKAGSESWTYVNPSANFTTYRKVIVDHVGLHRSPTPSSHVSHEEQPICGDQPGDLQSEIAKAFRLHRTATAIRYASGGPARGSTNRRGVATATLPPHRARLNFLRALQADRNLRDRCCSGRSV